LIKTKGDTGLSIRVAFFYVTFINLKASSALTSVIKSYLMW